jgi:lysine-N-methylase
MQPERCPAVHALYPVPVSSKCESVVMSWPLHPLPVLHNWDCRSCTNCCREYRVYLTDAERDRIAALDLSDQADLVGMTPVVREGSLGAGRYRLNQRSDGRCVFLGNEGRCRIHERFGAEAKPLACRLYPFVLVPAGSQWRIGLRFSCPSVARNQGRPLAEHETELRSLSAEIEAREGVAGRTFSPPALQRGQTLDWPDLLRFVEAITALLQDRNDRIERRWRKCLALASLCRQAKFEQIKGHRLAEFLNLLGPTVDAEVPASPRQLAAPSWVGRVLFRQALAVHIRKDAGPDRGAATHSRLSLLSAAWRFATGRGRVPHLNAMLPETNFAHQEKEIGPLPDACEEILERYYLVKVASLQFCGSANFGRGFWDGLDSLALTLPVILWLARALADVPRAAAMQGAVGIVDHNFGYNPHLGGRLQRFAVSLLAQRGELEKLIGWYSR